jgi:hypothetical protein
MDDPFVTRPLFFVHVMKTAGTTVTAALRDAFPPEHIYPNPADDGDLLAAMVNIEALTTLSPERLARTRLFAGHFPLVAAEMLGIDTTTMTVLREPVARVVSHLRQLQQSAGAFRAFAKTLHGIEAPTFDQIYADPYLHDRFLSNHQCRVFGMTIEDEPRSYVMPLVVDRHRLEVAKAQLEQVDVLGLTERLDLFRDEVARRFGLVFDPGQARNAAPAEREHPSDGLLRRIEDDNQLDLELYAHASRLITPRDDGSARR